ncbi:probable G-protein coupled receptor Mth-like 3 isoform X3 [Anoplolepis gracilipes]|uniref:probable G-protein coupled receptor Mth-like 3 isoform X3 n=1 Tax=Anoplolepis gracilipes TaxID=354296 RepID=UPI003BA1EFC0
MYDKSFEFWCCAFLFFASSTKPLQNFTTDNKQDDNSMVRYELDVNSTEKNDKETVFDRHNLRENFTMDYENVQDVSRINFRSDGRNDDNLIQNEFPVEYVKYHEKRNQMPRQLQTNFTKVDNNKNYIVPYETCNNITCIRLCCPLGDRYKFFQNCITGGSEYVFSDSYNFWSDTMQTEYKKIDEVFQLIVQDPCPNHKEIIRITLNDDNLKNNEYIFFENGTLYLPYFEQFVESTSYCLAFLNHDKVDAVICLKALTEAVNEKKNYLIKVIVPLINAIEILYWNCTVVSMLCMLTIFLTYYILPLQNIHSFMLRSYSSMIFIYYIGSIMSYSIQDKSLMYSTCVAAALISYFSSVASYFWLSVMSFDMWWTFRDFQSLQKNVKRQDRKKLLYSIIAWGGPFILTIICIIMEIAPSVPKSIQPRFHVICWFYFGAADQLYNYMPKMICSVISIILSIHTALKIMRYEKDTARRLKDSGSRCYNENKKCHRVEYNDSVGILAL